MNIVFDRAKSVFIPIVYTGMEPATRKNQLFSFPDGTDFSAYKRMYIYYNNSIVAVSTYTVLTREKRLRLSLSNFPDSAGAGYKLLCDSSEGSGLDFIDKFNLNTTVYTYASFEMSNQSSYSRFINLKVTSENLLLGFLSSYPLQFKSRLYTNGYPDVSLGNLSFFEGLNSSKLLAFFNGVYAGVINQSGYISNFTSSKRGLVEVIYQGGLEFSLSSSGPWSTSLTMPDLARNATVTVYVRYGQYITDLARYFFSIKVFSTEAV